MKWHGIGGRTRAKVLAFNFHVTESFQPHIVTLELHSSYGVQRAVVCQTIFRHRATEFNSKVTLLKKYSEVVIFSLQYLWCTDDELIYAARKDIQVIASFQVDCRKGH